MAIYAELFDGTRLEFPDGTDPAVIDRVAREETIKRQPKATPPEPKESTILGEAKRGFQQFVSGARTGAGAIFGSPEEAARAGLERSEKIEAEAGEGPSLERAKRVYEERGLLPAAGQVLSDIPRLLAQQGTQIGATIGGAKVGAGIGAAVAGPPGALIGGGLGAIGANVPSMFGQAMQRQAATQIEEGKPVDISMGRAAAATAGSAALEAAGTAGVLGKNLVKRVLGVGDDAALAAARSKEELVKAARATITGGAIRGAAVEMPVEVAQSVLDRWQAGLDVTGDDALKEYGESLYAAGLVGGPIGGASAIPTRRAAQRALEEQEPLAPGQRRGETLEQTANRLNTEVQGLTGQLQPPPPSPFLSDEQLASIAASENGFGKLVQYEETIKQEPSSPERNASLQASREFRRRLEIESQQRQTEPGKAYPFDPYAPEPFKFKSSTELVDLINNIEDPADKLTRILEYRAEVKAQPASAEREQALKDSSALYDEINKFVQAQGFPAPTPFVLRASDLTAAGINKKDPLFEQLKGKDINKPDDVDTVVKLTEEAQRRPNITPELFDRLEGLLTSVEAHLRDKPGSGFYGQRTYPKPSGAGVSVAGQPEPTVPAGGAEPSGRMGMVGPTAPAEPTVSGEKVAPAPVDEFLRAKPREEFGKAVGASYGSQLRARRDNPNLKAAVKGENLGGVLNALTRSKSPVVAEVAKRGAPAGTTVKIDDDAVEQYVGRSFLDDRFIIAEAKNILALRDALKNNTPFIETVVIDEDGNTKDVERVVQNTEIVRAKPYWMIGLKPKGVEELTLPQLTQAVDARIAEIGEDKLKLTATASAIRTGVAGGAYDPDTKTIRLAEYYAKDEGVVTHELVHAQVVEAVANPTKEQKPHVERLNKLYEHVKDNAKERGLDFYGVSSIQEFIAEGMSNPRFQFFLNTIPYEKQSAWTKFVQTIADLLGIKNNTAFLELLTVYDRITPPVKSKAKAAPARTPSQEEALAETFPPVSETAFEPGLEIGEPEPDPELLAAVKQLEAEREKAQKTKVLPKGQIFSLLSAVKGKLTISDTLDVSPDKNMRVLTAKSNGTFISELVNNSVLNKWLPPDKRPESNSYDVQESEEYIKDLLRNRDHAPYAVKEKLDQLNLQIRNLDDAIEQEKQLDILIRQANAELQAASEERRAEEAELPAAEREAGDTVRAEGVPARKSLAKVAPQVSEKKFQELERRAKQPSKPEPAKEEPEEVKAIRAERAEKIGQLQGVLEKILAKYGLKDVKLNLEEGMKDEGSYEGQLIKLALDLDNPVRTLRHEAIHALKELGFFTPAQWKVLTDRAKSEWIDRYLKGQVALIDGKEVTRYDAYMDLYKGDQDKIIEEAIADAFGDFVKTKAPPGMMQAILNRMKNLFKAIKETLNQGGYQTAEDVFGKIEEGKLTKAEKLVEQVGAKAKPSLRAPDTKEFKLFFGDSQVVDKQGEPKVMYHGTARDITSFVPKQAGAIFLTDDPKFAEGFANMSADWMARHADQFLSPEQARAGKEAAIKQIKKDYRADPKLRDKLIAALDNPDSMYATDANEILGAQYKDQLPSGPNIMPVFVRAENPFDFDNPDHIRQLQQYEYENRYTPRSIFHLMGQVEKGGWEAIEDPLVQQAIKQLGFDGFYVKEVGKKNLAVYSSTQIKSAIGNEGTYDITNADIRKSLRTLPTLPTDVTDRVKQTVIPRERPGMVGRLLDAISPRTFSKFREEFVNRYDALARFDRQAAEQIRLMGGTEQLADAKAESAALFSDLGGGLAASAMGVHDRVGGIPVYVRKYIVEKDFKKIGPDYTTKAAAEAAAKKVGGQVFEQGYTTISNANGVKGLIAIFADLAKYNKPDTNEPSVFDQYQFWADVKRASKYILNPGTGKYEEKLFTKDDIRRAAQIEQAFPEFVQIQKEWIKYNDGLVDFMRDTGVISEAGAKEMKKHGDYFPFYRHLGEDDIQGPRLFSSIANVKTLKKAKGSEEAVTDFFETIVRNTQSAIQSGIKNVAARRATDQAMRINEVFKLNRAESGPSVYRVLEDGKETYYRAQDPLFIDALKVLSQPDLPFIGLLAGPAKLLRNLVTKDPAFQLANMMRDSLSAYVSSGFKFTPMVATLKQYGTIIAGKSPEFNALLRGGVIGGYDYSRGVEASAEKLEKEMRKVAGAKTTLEKIASPVTSLWGALEKSSEASDAATRNEIYKRVLAETGNEAEALYQALEVMNFNRKGRSPIIRVLTAAVPFMNARIQGLDVLYRAGMRPIFGKDATEQEKARLKTFWVRGMTMMALSSMYWMLTSDDEEYKNQEQEVRDNYWLFPSLGIKIPIPFEIGVMFKVVPERILEYAFGSDTGEDFRKSMGRHLMSTFGFNPIPQTLLPAIEVNANYSFFTQRPIITQGMENIAPEYQVGPNTSKIAGAIGQTLGISPIKLDYLIQGYTGTMGMYAVNLFDSIFSMNDEAPKPSRRLEQMPVLRRFMVDPEARGQITAYYDLKNSVDQVVRTSNYLERSMDFEQYGKYMQENIKMLAVRDYINDLEKTMKEFREMKNLVRISKIDADEKRDSLTNIGRIEQQLTQNIKTLKKQLAAQQ